MTNRILTSLGAGALVLVIALGAWGWTDHDASAARHATALRAKNQGRFCANLGYAVSAATGQHLDETLPFSVPVVPPTEGDLVGVAGYIDFTFKRDLLPDAPPVLREDIERVAEAASEVSQTGSPKAMLSTLVLRSLQSLADYWKANCG